MNANNRKSRIAIVTGAARGIGREIASRLRSRDLHVCSLDVESCPIEGVQSLIVDLRKCNDVRKCLDDVRSSLGAPEFLVNNAALAGRAAEMGLPDIGATQHFHELTEVNLVAPFLLMEIFARDVISEGRGGREIGRAHV